MRNVSTKPGEARSSASFDAVRSCWLRVTAKPFSADHTASSTNRDNGSLPPISALSRNASPQPEIVPATVFAASGPRQGTALWPCAA